MSTPIDDARKTSARQRILSFATTKREHQVRIDAYTRFGLIAASAAAMNVPFQEAAAGFVASTK